VFGHPVIDQTIHKHGIDVLAIVVYAIAFAIVFVATRRRAAFGIAALIVTDPFALYRDVSDTTLTLPKVALLAVAVALASRRDVWGAARAALRSSAVRLLLGCALLVIATTALSIAQAEHRGPAIRETLKACEYALLFLCAAVATRIDPSELPLRVGFAIALGAVSLAALSQEVFGAPSGLWFFNHPIPRIAGPLEGPNQLAGYLGIALPLVVAFVLVRGQRRVELALLGLGAMALVLTLSRSGLSASILAVAIVFVFAPGVYGRRSVALALAGGAACGLGVLVLYGSTSLLARFSSFAEVEQSGGVGTRAELWHAAFVLWRAHPWLGIGAGNFELEIAKVGPAGIRTHANSLYLQSLVEGGVPLFAATVATVVASIVAFVRGPLRDPLVLGALGASAGLAVHQVFDFLVFYPKVGGMFWIVLGLGAARAAAVPIVARSASAPAVRPSDGARLASVARRAR
jgi:O-antigen ligase